MYQVFGRLQYKHFAQWFESWLDQERGRFILWIPVFWGVGIAGYFSCHVEPIYPSIPIIIAGVMALLSVLVSRQMSFPTGFMVRALGIAVFSTSAGFFVAHTRTHHLNTWQLDAPMHHITITGQVKKLETAPSKTRVTLCDVKLLGRSICVKLTTLSSPPDIGSSITATAALRPISGPYLPPWYHARRVAYFQGISAYGRLKSWQVHQHHIPEQTTIETVRHTINQEFTARLSTENRGIAQALVTGDRMYVSEEIRQAFTDAGIAHLLAISGLHVSFIAGLLFLFFRRTLCLWPDLAERLPLKKISALCVLPILFLYVLISGAGIPIQRAFLMISLVMAGIVFDRSALSMRSVAIAALVILALRPESLVSISFQLSFSAVIGLIAIYETETLRKMYRYHARKKILMTIAGTLITTVVATIMTTPLTLYHFQRFSLVTMLGNIVAIPWTGVAIMPCLLMCLISLIFGGSPWLFQVLDFVLMLLVRYTQWIASLPGAAVLVPVQSLRFMVLTSLGLLWLCLWKSRVRYIGGVFFILSCFTFNSRLEPALFITLKPLTVFFVNQPDFVTLSRTQKPYLQERLIRMLPGKYTIQNIHTGAWEYNHAAQGWRIFIQLPQKRTLEQPGRSFLCSIQTPEGSLKQLKYRDLQKSGALYLPLRSPERWISSCQVQGVRPWSEPFCASLPTQTKIFSE